MNNLLLNLNSSGTVATAAGSNPTASPTEPAADAATGETKAFAQLLEQAAEEQLLPGLAKDDSEKAQSEPDPAVDGTDEAVLVDAADLPADQASDTLVLPAMLMTGSAAPAPAIAEPSPTATAVIAAMSATDVSIPAELETNSGEDGLPVAGKALPFWQNLGLTAAGTGFAAGTNSAAVAHASAAGAGNGIESISDSAAMPDMVETAWSSLLKQSGETLAQSGRDAASALTRVRSDPVQTLAPLIANISAVDTRSSSGSLDKVPGIAVQSPHFANLLGNQVLWQAKVGNNVAEIRLDPPDLGPIEVRISQKDSETHLHFVVSHQTTREQLEQAMPRLRELFGQGGLQLGQVAVEQGKQDSGSDGAPQRQAGRGSVSDAASTEEVTARKPVSISLIDDYA